MVKVILDFIKSKMFAGTVAILIVAAFAYQNCAKVDFNSDTSIPVAGVTGSSIAMVVTGGGLPTTGVTSFTAVPGQSYLFQITGTTDAVNAGLNNAASSMIKVSGQCSGNSTYQPFTMDLTQAGPYFQFGNNTFSYTSHIADQVGGCVWRACVVDNNTDIACVDMTAQANSTTTTTTPTATTLATPTTMKATPTTLSPTPTTAAPTPTTQAVTPTTRPTPTTQAPPPTAPPPTAPPPTSPPPTMAPTPTTTTLPPTAWNCTDGFGVCGSGIAIVDDGSLSPSNPGSAYVSLKNNPSNGAPTQKCVCSQGTLTKVSCNPQTSEGYYVCSGGSTTLPACRWPGDPGYPGPYCSYSAAARGWSCIAHNTVAAKFYPCP